MRIVLSLLALLSLCLLGPAPATGQNHHDDHLHEGDHDEYDGDQFTDDYCEHDEHQDFDYFAPYKSHGRGEEESHGHTGHTSLEGYPFVHGIRVEIDFIERALEMDLARINNADDGMADELEFESEIVWAINNRLVFIVGAPLIQVDSAVEGVTTGVGDLELGLQILAFGGRHDLVFFSLGMTTPTGDSDRDLGAGHTILAPTAMWLHDFGGGDYFQGRFSWEIPVSTTDVGSEFKYDVGMYHTYITSKHWSMFRFLTPLIEANGITAINGTDHGDTVLDLTTGIRWVVREMDEVGVGWSFPITGSQNFSHQLILSYRLHF